MIRTLWKATVLSFIVWGCGDGGPTLNVRYEDVGGLSEKDRVLAANVPVGEVTGIVKKGENDYTVHVKIRKDYARWAMEDVAFTIVPDPEKKGRRALNMERQGKQGPLGRDGASPEGAAAVAEGNGRAWEEFEKGVREFKKELDAFSKEIGKIPESEEFQRLKKEIERIGNELKRSGKAAREKMEKEILPELERRFEELKEKILRQKKQRTPEPVQIRV